MKKIERNVDITIDPIYDSTSIFISLETETEDSGVIVSSMNAVYYDGKAIYRGVPPSDLKIVNKASELKGKKVLLYGSYSIVAPTEDEAKFPRLTWKPNLEAGDHTLYDNVEASTSDDNMFDIKVWFNFK